MKLRISWDDSNDAFAVKVYTHNIRYAADPVSEGEEPWSTRKMRVASSILFNTFNASSLVLLQEVLHEQLHDILDLLNRASPGDKWTYCGVGRDDGSTQGEYAPVLFRSSQFEVALNRTFWLSETPDVPSKGWDAASKRIVNVSLLKHLQSERLAYVLNTHLDDQGVVARKEGAKLINRIISGLEGHDILILGGDLNSEPEEDAYQVLTEKLKDASTLITGEVTGYGNEHTFTGFKDSERKKTIDYIFVYNDTSVSSYGVLPNRFDDGVYSSDHRPVIANVIIEKRD
ncbi:endonuclease/exonuclease/phosphatase [Myxozyma melibiosi]|uniref:Endonuclease/exonuclease/phosphatase n=1 Tax=Myxozyma melibiosi TaxID=54550 RepID=A0ABR1FAD3_9ASCO